MTRIHDDDIEDTHPAYGIAGFSRRSIGGGTKSTYPLFGSAMDQHATSVVFRLKTCERVHGLSHDRFHGKELLAEVEFSALQFSELLTSLNIGDGVPCTIRWINGGPTPPLPPQEMEVKRVRDGFDRRMADIGKKLRAFRDKAEEILTTKKTLNKDDREQILGALRMFVQEIEANVPYVLKSFEEASDKIITTAKAEVDACITHALVNAGIKAINEGTAEIPRLPGGDTE